MNASLIIIGMFACLLSEVVYYRTAITDKLSEGSIILSSKAYWFVVLFILCPGAGVITSWVAGNSSTNIFDIGFYAVDTSMALKAMLVGFTIVPYITKLRMSPPDIFSRDGAVEDKGGRRAMGAVFRWFRSR